MKLKYHQAKSLRRQLTPPEFLLWDRIKVRQPGEPVFRRQYPFGPYVLDFYCIKARLAIEVDGNDHGRDDMTARDVARDTFMSLYDVMTYRIPAADIFRDLDAVADGVWDLASARLKDR